MQSALAESFETSRYRLVPKKGTKGSDRHGALLRFHFPDLGTGFADCHPWTELGDAPLEKQLESLAAARPLPLISRSRELARIDASFRLKSQSSFQDVKVPQSHYLFREESDFDLEQAFSLVGAGFRSFKLKLRSSRISPGIRDALGKLKGKARFRFDFNGSLSMEEAAKFLGEMKYEETIEFIEDPVSWDESNWKSLQRNSSVRLAADRASGKNDAWICIVKPAMEDPRRFQGFRKVVFTSYLDHPLGQSSAAFEAGKFYGQNEAPECGLLSHSVYEKNAYSEILAQDSPFWKVPEGTGFGFDHLLAKEPWSFFK